jgi:hypothetical protein
MVAIVPGGVSPPGRGGVAAGSVDRCSPYPPSTRETPVTAEAAGGEAKPVVGEKLVAWLGTVPVTCPREEPPAPSRVTR